jgi:heptosyltransferase-3
VQWGVERLRRGLQVANAAREARRAIRQLAALKAKHPARPICGILLVEHIGDIIACEPVIAQMRKAHPTAVIVWIVRPQYRELLASHPGLDAIVVVNSLLSIERIIDARILDVTVDLHVNSKVTDVAGRVYHKKAGDPSISVDSYVKQGSLLQSFSRAAGVEASSAAPVIFVPTETVEKVDRLSLPEHFIAVHPSSNYVAKDWTPSAWRDLVRDILDRYETHVLEIGLTSIITLDHPRFVNFCGKLSLIQTAEVIRRSAFFIGIDSGPAHMANAWRRPALLLFGRYAGSDTFNPFEGFFRESAETVLLRYPGRLREQTPSRVMAALDASPLWAEATRHLKRVAATPTSLSS